MSLNQSHNWLVAYDIASPRRLNRVHRLLVRHGVPLQYSLFSVTDNAQHIDTLRDELADCIDPRQDDVRIYRLPSRIRAAILGRGLLPDGVLLFSGPVELWRPPSSF
jgi:CRISPR-associated protein Cas2